MATDKWATVDLPVLRKIDELSENLDDVTTDILEDATRLPRRDLEWSLRRLYDAGYVTGLDATGFGQTFDLLAIRLQERGLQAVGAWPADSYEQLLIALRDAEARETDPETKSRLRKLLDGVVGAGRDVAVSVLTDWAKGQAGL